MKRYAAIAVLALIGIVPLFAQVPKGLEAAD